MNVYFCINDVLDRLEKSGATDRLDMLIDVSTTPPDCGGFPADVFVLSSRPTLLDLNQESALNQLALLLEEVPLYHFNMELALDEALSERPHNATVDRAIRKAFGSDTMPNMLRGAGSEADELSGSLRHPMLEHLDELDLCRIYINFLKNLGLDHRAYNFDVNILGKHETQFAQHFDGYLLGNKGKVQAEILIGFGLRVDHDPGRPLENYVAGGQKKARNMRISEPREMLWAWLEADHYQMRRCRDIHRVKLVQGLPRPPNWIRTDIFALLEKEAVKQFLAEGLTRHDAQLGMLDRMPSLKRAVQANAEDQVDELLQQLLSQTLNLNAPYSGAAGKFADAAARRAEEARQEKIS